MKKLFFDGSCKLCLREISWLAAKLSPHLQLVDISDASFIGFAGVTKAQMMQQIHLWNHDHFVTGVDATLFYWHVAGYTRLVRFLRFTPCYWLASVGYKFGAIKRIQCSDGQCELLKKLNHADKAE
ncbi:DUF393 domain-containing protein [Rheinheimera sp. D18]|uniref:thiol-disulfide oxidoreductase DCC family protein n=1 Tax=Rheinheimera sp. D18 TaxID=2545632 RepID=UPI001053E28E|nr:DCC1-like thiol-disulfide oxidoreductase family protein [Rheinheimera sp. D18]QBL09752.1 DUF393 domain-containing protein [Rheinheimera sp. D18]